jgi:hypothetical protein
MEIALHSNIYRYPGLLILHMLQYAMSLRCFPLCIKTLQQALHWLATVRVLFPEHEAITARMKLPAAWARSSSSMPLLIIMRPAPCVTPVTPSAEGWGRVSIIRKCFWHDGLSAYTFGHGVADIRIAFFALRDARHPDGNRRAHFCAAKIKMLWLNSLVRVMAPS